MSKKQMSPILLIVVIFTLIGCNNKDNQLANAITYESNAEIVTIVEVHNKRNNYFLTLRDFNPSAKEFDEYNRQFEIDTNVKHIIINDQTLIIDKRTEPYKLMNIIDLNTLLENLKSVGEYPFVHIDYNLTHDNEIYGLIVEVVSK